MSPPCSASAASRCTTRRVRQRLDGQAPTSARYPSCASPASSPPGACGQPWSAFRLCTERSPRCVHRTLEDIHTLERLEVTSGFGVELLGLTTVMTLDRSTGAASPGLSAGAPRRFRRTDSTVPRGSIVDSNRAISTRPPRVRASRLSSGGPTVRPLETVGQWRPLARIGRHRPRPTLAEHRRTTSASGDRRARST